MSRLRFAHFCILFVSVVTFTLFFRCSVTPLAGGGTEGGNVDGLFVNDDGSTPAMVLVKLIPSNYNPGDVNQSNPIITTYTATDGSYSFGRVLKGSYSIEAVDSANGKRTLISGLTVTDDDLQVPTDTLRDPGSMKIFLPETVNPATGYLFVPGTSIFAAINGASGSLFVTSVPAATLPAVCYSETGSSSIDTIRYSVAVSSRKTVTVANPEWKYSRMLVLNTAASGAGISGNVLDFPVLIRLTASNFNFSQANADGSDIRFTRSDTSLLPYEIELWDPSSGRAEVWVNVDTVFGNDSSQHITLYWGNSDAISSSNSTVVFDTANGFAGVWHMNENPAAGANAIKDRTANSFNATPRGSMNAADVVDAAIGKGLDFDGSNDYCNAGKIAPRYPYSIGLWVQLNRMNYYQRFIFQDYAYTLWYDSDWIGARMEHVDSSGNWRGIPQDGGLVPPMITGVWYYLVGTYDEDKIRLYVNGRLATETNSVVAYPFYGYDLLFGQSWNMFYFKGIMDEIRIEKTARSVDWITLCYMNQRSDDRLVVFK